MKYTPTRSDQCLTVIEQSILPCHIGKVRAIGKGYRTIDVKAAKIPVDCERRPFTVHSERMELHAMFLVDARTTV
jgi:hypothetical protein